MWKNWRKFKLKKWNLEFEINLIFYLQPKQQTAVHIVASRQTATATSILRVLLAAAGKDIRLKADGVSNFHTSVQ